MNKLTDDEKMLGFDQYCDEDMDWLIKDLLSNAYGNIQEINRQLEFKYPNAKNYISKLVQNYGKACFDAGKRTQKNIDSRILIEANEERYQAEQKVNKGIYLNADMIKICMEHGISQEQMSKALGTNRTRLYLLLKKGEKESDTD